MLECIEKRKKKKPKRVEKSEDEKIDGISRFKIGMNCSLMNARLLREGTGEIPPQVVEYLSTRFLNSA